MEFQFEGLTLSNLAGGRLEELFQEALATIVEIDGELEQYAATNDGDVKAAVTITLGFTLNSETGLRTLNATVGVKRPARKALATAIHVQNGAVLIQPRLEQTAMFPGGNVARIDDARTAREGE